MKPKRKGKKMKGKGFHANKDMEEILADSRFAHVPFDAKLRNLPKEERKVKLDSRFSSMFSDEKFHEKSTMDPRGKIGNYSTKEDLRKFYEFSSSEEDSDDEEEESESEDNEKELQEKEEDEKDSTLKIDSHEDNLEKKKSIAERLQDMSQDYARGTQLFSDDSSDDDSSSEDGDQEEEFEWGELDQDAIWDTEQEVEETSRIAVCNLDWNHIKAVDILVVFTSFCPRGGSVKVVTIYQSEFGKQKMAEEDQFGPMELRGDAATQRPNNSYGENQRPNNSYRNRDVDLERLEKGKLNYRSDEGGRSKYEALRRYERNRLRYYYAVVECDSVETAKVLYKECDRQSFERAGVYMDLRYIPTDMTFDEAPHEVCTTVPEFYEAKLFTTTALFDSQPTLTWDQTDPHRQKVLANAMKNAMSGNKINEEYLKNFIASSSEEDSPIEEEEDSSSDEGEDTKSSRIAKFRALIQEIDEKEKKKASRFDMEQVLGIEDEDKEQEGESEDDSDDDKKDLKPFEKYLEKRKTKRKEREKKKKEEDKTEDGSSDEERNSKNVTYSDDELPEGMGDIYNDPFFAEELKGRQNDGRKEKKEKKKKKERKTKTDEDKNKDDKGDLELLLMEEDEEENKHFSMRDIIEEHKGKSKKKLKKKARQKMEEKMKRKSSHVDDFKVDVKDPRFTHLLTSGEYNIDPSHPQFKRTKAMDNLINDVQKKRIAESYENTPDPKRVNTSKGREEHELSLLVKRVKSKTKKPKKT